MTRRIYWLLIIIAFLSGILLYTQKDVINNDALVMALFGVAMFLVAGIHGIIVHTLKPQVKGGLIVYPVVMGGVFGLILFLFVYLIMPLYCDCF